MEQTFDLMDAMARANPRTQHYGIFLYTPFPSPLLDELPPEFSRRSRWRSGAGSRCSTSCRRGTPADYVEKLRSISAVTRWAFYPRSRIDEHGLAFKAAYGAMCGAARLRWRHRAFRFPVELRLANAAAQRLRGFL